MALDPGLDLAGGSLQRLPGNASLQEVITVVDDMIDRLNGLLKTQVLSDGNNKRMLIGFQQDGWGTGKNFGIKISMENIDVTTATDSQLLFKMDLETWKWQDPTGRNFVNIGLRKVGTYGFEMAKPSQDLN